MVAKCFFHCLGNGSEGASRFLPRWALLKIPRGRQRIAWHFGAGFGLRRDEYCQGRKTKRMILPSLRDLFPFPVNPVLKSTGLFSVVPSGLVPLSRQPSAKKHGAIFGRPFGTAPMRSARPTARSLSDSRG